MPEKPAGRLTRVAVHSEIVSFVLLMLTLFVFWVILSGRMEVKFLAIGLASAVGVAWITRPLLVLPRGDHLWPAWDLPWFRLIAYLPWLLWQLVLSNIQVAWLVLQPGLPVDPQVVCFDRDLPAAIAHVVLANSITLTPGTVTMDLEGNRYTVHALSLAAAQSLVPEQGEGEMQRRVASVFSNWGGQASGTSRARS